MILHVEKINTYYGLSHILFDVSLDISEGEMVCLLGRNGVGKSTTLKSIIGLVPPRSGKIELDGRRIIGVPTHRIAYLGIGYVPENRIIFPDLTVRENLQMGIKRGDACCSWNIEKIYHMFPVLKDRERQQGGTLSGGQQQMLTIARTLMGNPRLLLLDEPSEGLAPLVVKELENQIRGLKAERITILLSEQNVAFTLGFSERAYILEKGHVRWNGNVADLQHSPEIIKTYLGV